LLLLIFFFFTEDPRIRNKGSTAGDDIFPFEYSSSAVVSDKES